MAEKLRVPGGASTRSASSRWNMPTIRGKRWRWSTSSDEDLRGDVVGEITDEGRGAAVGDGRQVHLEKILPNETPRRPVRKGVEQVGHHIPVGLDREQGPPPPKQKLREHPLTRSHFQELIDALDVDRLRDPTRDVGLGEEVLAVRLFGFHRGGEGRAGVSPQPPLSPRRSAALACRGDKGGLPRPVAPVQGPELDRLRQVRRPDILTPPQIGDGPGHLQDPIVGPGRQL